MLHIWEEKKKQTKNHTKKRTKQNFYKIPIRFMIGQLILFFLQQEASNSLTNC